MVIITLKTILNENGDYHLCLVNLLFWPRQKMIPHTKYRSTAFINNFIKSSRDFRKMANDPHRVHDPRLKTTVLQDQH